VTSVPQGFWRAHFRAGHPAELGQIARSEVQEAIIETNYPVWDVLVQVERVAGANATDVNTAETAS
jgi:hypothetical protein